MLNYPEGELDADPAPACVGWGGGADALWAYVEEAGPEGVIGWIAGKEAYDRSWIHIEGTGYDQPLAVRGHFSGWVRRGSETRRLTHFACRAPWNGPLGIIRLRINDKNFCRLLVPGRKQNKARSFPFFWGPRGRSIEKLSSATGPVLWFSPINWGYRRQRSQHLAAELARTLHAPVWFFGPEMVSARGPAQPTLLPTNAQGVSQPALGAPPLDLASRAIAPDEVDAIVFAIKHLLVDHTPRAVVVQFPSWWPVARAWTDSAPLVYDCIDLHEGLPHVRSDVVEEERELTAAADLCTTTSPLLTDRLSAFRPKRSPVLLPNAAAPPRKSTLHARRSGRVVYVGAIEDWFDFDLVWAAAMAFPNTRFELIGKVEIDLPPPPANIRILGELAHERAMFRLRGAAVGLIPFKSSQLIRAVDPVKLYEYLAHGCAVVTTPMPSGQVLSVDGVFIAETANEFVQAVGKALTHGSTTLPLGHIWSDRAQALARALLEVSGEKGKNQ